MGEILEALRRYHGDGGPVEIRLIRAGEIRPRFCSTVADAAAEAVVAEREGWDVYFTPNMLPAGFWKPNGAATADADVVRRRWFLFDVDVKKPTGTAATDAQRPPALAMAREVLAWFVEAGADPRGIILTDSGNGYHVDIRTDAPADDASAAIARGVLHRIKAEFSREGLDVDLKVYNAARIWRLPGTTNRKSGRPCVILEGRPDALKHVTPWEVFEGLAELPVAPSKPAKPSKPAATSSVPLEPSADVVAALEALGVAIVSRKRRQDGSALFGLDRCPLPGSSHDADRGTFVVIQPGFAPEVHCLHGKCLMPNGGASSMRLDRLVPARTGRTIDGRAVCEIDMDRRPEIEATVAAAVADVVFRRMDGSPVLMCRREEAAGPPGSFRFRNVTAIDLQKRAASRFQFWRPRPDGRPPMRLDLPREWAEGMIQDGPTHTEWRTVRGVSGLPLLDLESGDMTSAPGYHAGSQLWLDTEWIGAALPMPSSHAEAVRIILEPFEGWLANGDIEPGYILAAVLTAVLRPSIPTAPIFAVTAGTIGSGKTWLAQTVGIIATGAYPHTFSAGDDASELDKRISSAMLEGHPAVLVDNIKRPLSSDLLEAATTGQVRIRRFGTQETEEPPSSRQFWMVTYNNQTISADLTRRTCVVNLEPAVEAPSTRKFDFKPQTRAFAHRARIVGAAYWLLQDAIRHPGAWNQAGSFEEWAQLVDAACQRACDGFSPAESMRQNVAADPDVELLRTLAFATQALEGPWALAEVLPLAAEVGGGVEAAPGEWSVADAFLSVVREAGDKRGGPDRQAAGLWLRRQRGRVVALEGVGSVRLREAGRTAGKMTYDFSAVRPAGRSKS